MPVSFQIPNTSWSYIFFLRLCCAGPSPERVPMVMAREYARGVSTWIVGGFKDVKDCGGNADITPLGHFFFENRIF